MILGVRHVTTYRYDRPVRAVIQSHRLEPARFDGQRVLDWKVEVSNGLRGGGFRDGAGDWVQGWTVPGPVEAVTVTVTGQVATTDLAGVLQGHREKLPPEAWLRATPATRCDPGMAELAEATAPGAAGLDLAHALAGAVAEAIAYTPGATDARTSAAEALAQGSGVCQDHAQVLIGLARRRDQPARYVSGYLLADAEGAAHEAAHAWAEIWIDRLGWVGFDAANRCCPDARYIRLGSGFDAADAAPIRGIARGGGQEALDVTVAVEAQQQ